MPKTITEHPEKVGLFSQITDDVLNASLVEALDDSSLLLFMQTSHAMCARLMHEDGWLNRMALLSSLYPDVAYLERGLDGEAFSWYWRM